MLQKKLIIFVSSLYLFIFSFSCEKIDETNVSKQDGSVVKVDLIKHLDSLIKVSDSSKDGIKETKDIQHSQTDFYYQQDQKVNSIDYSVDKASIDKSVVIDWNMKPCYSVENKIMIFTFSKNDSMQLLTSDFTLEVWFKPLPVTFSLFNFADQSASGFCNANECSDPDIVEITGEYEVIISGDYTYKNSIEMKMKSPIGKSNFTTLQADASFDYPNWYHLAIQRKAGAIEFYVNGKSVKVTQTVISGGKNPSSYEMKTSKNLKIGNMKFGLLSEVRITKKALYNGNFIAPTESLHALPDTVLLYHFDEGAGYKFIDVSGKNNDGYFIDSAYAGSTAFVKNAVWVKEASPNCFSSMP